MCGLTGFWDPRGSRELQQAALRSMTDAIRHRGPDDDGYWLDPDHGLGLGHRRLSIIDLSQEGHQPMTSGSGRTTVVFNGEIFNYRELAQELGQAGYRFRGSSDTEVLLAAIEHWGMEAALSRFVGMFALALWDRTNKTLTLARDRAGIKPLYYSLQNDRLSFGSELKCLLAFPSFHKTLNTRALHHYLRLGYVPGPLTIFDEAAKMEQGQLRVFRLEAGQLVCADPVPFWRLDQIVTQAKAAPQLDKSRWLAGFQEQLDEAVGCRLVADVPLGAFLSGGIDSSLVVATMQRIAPQAVKTYSIGFKDAAYNEAEQARAIAQHLGTDHHELYLEESQLRDLVPQLPEIWCEPFGDSSQLPTLLLARFAREQVTVALSGDGGDELAAGYIRHQAAAQLHRMHQRFPAPIRRVMAGLLTQVPTAAWDQVYKIVAPLLPGRHQARLPGDKLHKLGRGLRASNLASLYEEVVSLDVLGPLLAPEFQPPAGDACFPWPMPEIALSPAENFMVRDFYRYLPDDVLTKVDRASMRAGLEARVPLLDHRLLAYMWSLDESSRLQGGVGKYLLREALALKVPRALWERPKMGFAVPIGTWLKGPLRPWAEDLLQDVTRGLTPWLQTTKVMKLWYNHLHGIGNTSSPMWFLLMFLAWRRRYL